MFSKNSSGWNNKAQVVNLNIKVRENVNYWRENTNEWRETKNNWRENKIVR